MGVEIDVDLDVEIADDIAAIKTQLESLEEDLDIDLDLEELNLDDFEGIELTDDDVDLSELNNLDEDLELQVKLDETSLAEALAKVATAIHGFERDNDIELGVKIDKSQLGGVLGGIKKKIDSHEDDIKMEIDLDKGDLKEQLEDVSTEVDLLGDVEDDNGPILSKLKDIEREIKKLGNGIASGTSSSDGDSGSDGSSAEDDEDDARGAIRRLILSQQAVASDSDSPLMGAMKARGPQTGTLDSLREDFEFNAKKKKRLSNLRDSMLGVRRAGGRLTGTLKKLRPTFAGLYAIVATLLPAIIAIAGEVAALGVALGGLALAGGAIGVLGFLGGQADTLEGSMAAAEQRAKSLKEEIFGIFEPVADQFSGDVSRFTDALMPNLAELRGDVAGLDVFSDTFIDLLDPVTNAIEGVIQTFIKYEGVISGIAKQAVNLIAQNLPGFLEGILNEAGKSADGLFELFGAAFQLARMFYFLFETITQILKALSILAPVFKLIGTLLSNEMVQSVVLLITLLVSLVGILYGLAGVLSYVASGALGSLLTGIYASIASIPTLIGEIYALNGALGVTAGLVSLITGGLALVAGGLLAVGALDQIKSNLTPEVPSASGSNEFSSSSRGDTIINIDGNVDEPTKQKFVDVATQTSRRDQMTSGNYGLGG